MLDYRYNGWGTYEFLLSNQLYASYTLTFTISNEDEIELLNKFFAEINTDLLRLDSVKLDFPKLSIHLIRCLSESKNFSKLEKFVKQHAKIPLHFDKRFELLYHNNDIENRFATNIFYEDVLFEARQDEMIKLWDIEQPYDQKLNANVHFDLSDNIDELICGKIKFNESLTWKVPIEWLKFKFPKEYYDNFSYAQEKPE